MMKNEEILVQLICKGFEGKVGPVGGEDPIITGNEFALTSQGPDAWFKVNEDGSINDTTMNHIKENDYLIYLIFDCGYTKEEAIEISGKINYRDNAIDLLNEEEVNTMFMYFKDDNPKLYQVIKEFVGYMKKSYLEKQPRENKYIGRRVFVGGMTESDFEGCEIEDLEELLSHNGQEATIKNLECDCDGTFQNAYWTVEFDDGFVAEGIHANYLTIL